MAAHRPELVVLDVNETLSDMSPLRRRFADLGVPQEWAGTWFASLLRDGFALTVTGDNPDFAQVGRELLPGFLAGSVEDVPAAVDHVMDGFGDLALHDDVVPGLRALREAGLRVVTLSNGSTAVAQGLLERAGAADLVERLLSVEDAPRWKPAPEAYRHALDVCGVAAERAMLVAVHPWDVHGAHRAGLGTAWVARGGGGYPGHLSAPDLTVEDLPALARALAEG
ncbi:Putative FMN hydrolase [Serinicoccus hydrothermalis]|uniref:FMN hydrolase n=1 Tax=Serinicoccus hydrothermalis TaxID=1758689 RepID=A0A1B1N9K3_9MICO|nr:haloacid dehalogenase type II [Serinicoccus hydrothermalis]ANS78130.1 Putative FMN hydrolase [Serinicoccus hydrothermalis]